MWFCYTHVVAANHMIHYHFICLYFSKIRLTVSGSMELLKVKNFVMVGEQWRVEAGANCDSENEEVLSESMAEIFI